MRLRRSLRLLTENRRPDVLGHVKGDIEFRHISFKYPSRLDVQIFQDLCLSIRAGKTIALVGDSGSGKSTVIALLQSFYDPDSGQITLDGLQINTLQLKWPTAANRAGDPRTCIVQ